MFYSILRGIPAWMRNDHIELVTPIARSPGPMSPETRLDADLLSDSALTPSQAHLRISRVALLLCMPTA